MSQLIARASIECVLYIELHPCQCGKQLGPTDVRIATQGNDVLAIYERPCPGCAVQRRFEFVIDPDLEHADGGKFGGARPSKIIDAGQFLAVADASARAVPVDLTDLDRDECMLARELMERAVAAIEEVIKFIPPQSDRVPFDALFTEEGKAIYADEPGRVRRSRLDAVLGAYRASKAFATGSQVSSATGATT